MKKIAKFNPNVRAVGDVLTYSMSWALFSDVHAIMTRMARIHMETDPEARRDLSDHQMTDETVRMFPLVLGIVRHLTPIGFEALHHTRAPKPIDSHGRLQTSFRAETVDGEAVLHMIKADRQPHPLLTKRNKQHYMVCHYYIYPDRNTDNVRWEVETFNDATPERLDSYLPLREESKYYPPLEGVKLACMSYLNYAFGQATNRHSPETRSLAIQPKQLITTMGTLSTQALLDEMRVRWAANVSARNDDIWSAQEKCFLDVPTYPFEFNVDPTQSVKSPHSSHDDCEVWELFVYRVENDAMTTTSIGRYTNEYQVLNKLGTSASDRQARRHARLATKYQAMARVIREVGLNPPGNDIDVYSDRLGAKIVKES